MGIFSKILNKEKKEKPPAGAITQEVPQEKTAGERETTVLQKRAGGLGILSAPHITEKAVAKGEKSVYVFRIPKGTSKIQVRDAVERKFGVHAIDVRIAKSHSKLRRMGRGYGLRPGLIKAVVTLREGEHIELGA
jgi:large subunit ribosomal protein L23